MSNKNKFLASVGFYLLVGALLFYAASRTLHFVQNVMAESTWGYLFLFATGGGAVIWLYVYLTLAEGAKQRGISFAMGLIDLVGELALVYADTIFVGDQAGLVTMSEDEMQTFVVVSVAIVGVNILAGYLFKLFDLHQEQAQKAQDLIDHVTDATMKSLNTPEAKNQMVAELEPVLREAIKSQVASAIYERANGSQGIDARSVGLNIGQQTKGLDTVFPRAVMKAKSEGSPLWLQAITAKDGTRKRAFCLSCMLEGKSWIGGELCTHFENVEPAAPESKLEPPSQASGEK